MELVGMAKSFRYDSENSALYWRDGMVLLIMGEMIHWATLEPSHYM